MKKILTSTLLAVASVFAANAGNGFIGGNVGFVHEQTSEYQTNRFTFMPEIGYSFNERWAIGTTIGYDYTHYCGWKTNVHMFDFNPYGRYTYYKSSNGFCSLFIDGTVGIGLGTVDYDGDDSDTAVTWQVGLRPGLALHFSEKFSLVTHIGFLGYKGANNTALDAGYKRIGGISYDYNDLTFGFYYTF